MKRSYKDINPADVNLFTRDVLFWMIDGGLDQEVSSRDVAAAFDVTPDEASKRLSHLKKWGVVRTKRRKRPFTYVVTNWGRKWAKDRKKKDE